MTNTKEEEMYLSDIKKIMLSLGVEDDIYINHFPRNIKNNKTIVLMDHGGVQRSYPHVAIVKEPKFSIKYIGDDYKTIYRKLEKITLDLRFKNYTEVGRNRYYGFVPIGGIINTGKDENGRYILSMNFRTAQNYVKGYDEINDVLDMYELFIDGKMEEYIEEKMKENNVKNIELIEKYDRIRERELFVMNCININNSMENYLLYDNMDDFSKGINNKIEMLENEELLNKILLENYKEEIDKK